MKAFIVSICIVVFLFTLTFTNGFFIKNITDTLISDAKHLSQDDESVDIFIEKWEKMQFFVRISSSHKETHRIDEILSAIKAKELNNINSGFYEDCALLIQYLKQIQDDETVTFDSII